MSSGNSPRLRSLSTLRRSKHRPSSPSPRRRRSPITTPRKVPNRSEPINILPKYSSEPLLPGTSSGSHGSPTSSDGWFYRNMTCNNLFPPSSPFLSPERLSSSQSGYQKDTKVVVTVTVEGSPGPVRIMSKLGSTVNEIVKMVVEKYGKEGRTPKLDQNAASIYDLHLSYFSLESLDKSNSIGDIGSRNFYLRKCENLETLKPTALASEFASAELHSRTPPSIMFIHSHFTRKFAKVSRRMRRLWKVLCLHCS